jgi:class 3 adenylate cyclase
VRSPRCGARVAGGMRRRSCAAWGPRETMAGAMALPAGTVTLLFSDIEGSTRLLEHLGERFSNVLDEHRRIVRGAVVAHGGYEVRTEGDAFFVAFVRASDAVRAAVAAQRGLAARAWPGGVVVRVRMGVHTGEPRVVGGDYVGMDVHRAARICSAAHGGQVVVSETTERVLSGGGVEGLGVRDLGVHRLKDLTRPVRLYQVVADGLMAEFPPLRALEREITELVGQIAPQLLSEPGFGPLIAAKLVGEIAGAQRFATPAKLARAAGVAPIPTSSGNTRRQRLDQGGNRQINAALHRVIVARARCHHRPATTSSDAAAKARAPAKRSAASSATSPATSGDSCSRPTPPTESSPHQFLDIEATEEQP